MMYFTTLNSTKRVALNVNCCVCSRFVRCSVEEDEEDCEETQSSKQHTVNGNATNGLLEEGSPSKYTHTHIHTFYRKL